MSWPLVPLQDVAFFQEGPGVRKWQFRTAGIKLVNVKNIVNGVLDTSNSDKYLDPEEVSEKYSHFLADSGDLVMASSGATWGKTAWVEKKHLPLCMNTSMIRFKTLDKNRLDLSYLHYYLKTADFRSSMEKLITGSAQPNFGSSHLKQIEIPLPPLTEQKRIAAILDKADAIRRKRQQAIQLADEFLRAVFLDMFGDPVANPKGWEEQPLHTLADIRSGVTKGKKVDLNRSETLPYMRVANVQDGYLDLSDIKQIVVSETDAKKYVLKRGDLLLTEGGDPDKLGRGYVWNGEIENCLHQNHIFSVRIKTSKANLIRPQFLSATVGSLRGKRYFLKVGKQTTGIATINKTVLSEFAALVPPVKLQDKYIAICNKVASLKNTYTQGDLDLMQSCQQSLF